MSPVHLLTEVGIVSQKILVGVDGHFLVEGSFGGGEGEVFESPSVELARLYG